VLPFQEASASPWPPPPIAAAVKASSAASSLACAGKSVVMEMKADSSSSSRLTERIVLALLCCWRSTIVNGAWELGSSHSSIVLFYIGWICMADYDCQRP
jgi:hypothetical protein